MQGPRLGDSAKGQVKLKKEEILRTRVPHHKERLGRGRRKKRERGASKKERGGGESARHRIIRDLTRMGV